jgi:hypothetical protein
MDTPEPFPGESAAREEALGAGWHQAEVGGSSWALLFESAEDEDLTLRVYPSFFLEGVRPAFLLVEPSKGTRRGPRWACRSGSFRGTGGSPRPRRRGSF